MMSTYFTSTFAQYLDYSADLIEQLIPTTKGYYIAIRNFVKFGIAQAIITWILAIPAISIIIVSLSDQLINEKTVNEMGKFYLVQTVSNEQPRAKIPV